jgi:hypothetical protein
MLWFAQWSAGYRKPPPTPLRRHHRARDQQPQFPRRGAPKALGSAARRLRPAPPPRTSPVCWPGGTTGLLIKDDKGKDADRLVYGVDTASSLNCALPRRFGPLYDNSTATCGSSAGLGDAVKRRSNADSCARSWPSTPI